MTAATIAAGTRWRLAGRRFITVLAVTDDGADCRYTDSAGRYIGDAETGHSTLSPRYLERFGVLVARPVPPRSVRVYQCAQCLQATPATGSRLSRDGRRVCPDCA